MDESVRGRLRAAAPDGLTSPEQVTARRMPPAATRKPAASGTRTSRRTSQRPDPHAPEPTTNTTGRLSPRK